MLTVEEIKRAIEEFNPVGFTYDEMGLNNIYGSCFGWGLIEGYGNDIDGFSKWTNIYYPLFLQKVIEGINTKTVTKGYVIVLFDRQISVFQKQGFRNENSFNFIINQSIDQAKEQAIKYILEKL